jgi:hypothetical protein
MTDILLKVTLNTIAIAIYISICLPIYIIKVVANNLIIVFILRFSQDKCYFINYHVLFVFA